MNKRLAILLVTLFLPLLLACSFTTLLSSTPAPNIAATLPAGQTPAADLRLMENDATQVVASFFGALQNSPDGAGAEAFLTDALRQSAGGRPASLVSSDAQITAFQLSAVTLSPDAASASVDASVEMPQAVNLRVDLVRQDARWLIANITLLQGAQDYPATPEQVVQAFLTAYQETPDQMSRYLSQQRLAELPPGGAVAMLDIQGILEGSMIESAAVSMNPPSAVVDMSIQAGGQLTRRRFTLLQDGGLWKIDTVE